MLDTTTDAGAHADRRLREEGVAWLTTVRFDDRGGDVVRAEGGAEILNDFPPVDQVEEYVEKYRRSIAGIGFDPEGPARAYSVALRVTPERWQVW